MDCFGNGACLVDNRCFCFDGWSGRDCSVSSKNVLRIVDEFVLSANVGAKNLYDGFVAAGDEFFSSFLLAQYATLSSLILTLLILN